MHTRVVLRLHTSWLDESSPYGYGTQGYGQQPTLSSSGTPLIQSLLTMYRIGLTRSRSNVEHCSKSEYAELTLQWPGDTARVVNI